MSSSSLRFGKRDRLNARVEMSSAPILSIANCLPNEQIEIYLCNANNELIQALGYFQANINGFISLDLSSIPTNKGYKLVFGNDRASGERVL